MIGGKGRKIQIVFGRIFVSNEDNAVILFLQIPLFFQKERKFKNNVE